MSAFAENAWEADETGDKLSKEFSSKKRKGRKRSEQGAGGPEKKNKTKGSIKSKKNEQVAKYDEADIVVAGSKNNRSKKRSKSSDSKADDVPSPKKLKANVEGTDLAENAEKPQRKSKKDKKKVKSKLLENTATSAVKNLSINGSMESTLEQPKLKVKKNKTKGRINAEMKDGSNLKAVAATKNMTKSQKRRIKRKRNLLNVAMRSANEKVKKEEPSIIRKNLENNIQLEVESPDRLEGKKKREKVAKPLVDNPTQVMQGKDSSTEKNRNKTKPNIDKLKKMLSDKQKCCQSTKKEPESLRDRMLARLKSSRFRYLNEQMYNSESSESKKYFKEEPDAFMAYHEGYRQQVEQWPLNPLDTIIASVKKMPKEYVIADFGCGEARLAESVPQKVHSLDLVAANGKVTACDMAHTPLLTSRIDVVIFCLSLMGTNLGDYLIEANRVLKNDGILKIAEVESRFDDVEDFIKNLNNYGFVNTFQDLSHNLFYFMDFKKVGEVKKKRNTFPPLTLKPCLYKKR